MQVTVEVTEGLGRKMKVQVPVDRIEPAIKKRLEEVAKTARVDGFRQGKIPADYVQKYFGPSVREEVLRQVLGKTYVEALEKEKLDPLSEPQIEVTVFEEGKPLEYTATMEVFPSFALKSLDKAKIEQWKGQVSEEDVENELQNFRKNFSTWKEVDRPAQADDQLTIDFEATIDGKPFDGAKEKNVSFVLGDKSMLPDFEKVLVGKRKGADVQANVHFPEAHVNKAIAGKVADFRIHLHKVLEREVPELNDELVQKIGLKEGGVEKFRAQVRESLEGRFQRLVEEKNKEMVFAKWIELNDAVEIPVSLLAQERKQMQANAIARTSQMFGGKVKLNWAESFPESLFEKEAVNRVKLGLLMKEGLNQFHIQVDDHTAQSLLFNMMGGQSDKQKEHFKQMLQRDPSMVMRIKRMLIENMLFKKLVETANVQTTEVSFKEFTEKAPEVMQNESMSQF